MSVAAGDLSGIGSTIAEANSLASGSTLSVVAPAADSVSAELAALFGGHAQTYQADELKALIGLPEAFIQSTKDLLHGNISGAINDVLRGFGHLFISGLKQTIVGNNYIFNWTGALPDLWHLMQIPADELQNLENILKSFGFGIMGGIVQHLASPLEILATYGQFTIDVWLTTLTMNPLLALTLDVLGAPILATKAFEDSIQAAYSALLMGHPLRAATKLWRRLCVF